MTDASAVRLADRQLTQPERVTLTALCDALLPSLPATDGDSLELFSAGASDRGVAQRVEETLSVLGESERSRFRLFLRTVEQPLMTAMQTGRLARFSSLSQAEAEAVLVSLAKSRLPDLRSGFQAIRRLATFHFYSGQSGSPDSVWNAIGYVPSSNPPAAASPLALTPITGDTVLDADVCVIGSGAGGSVAASVLAASGKSVVVLEAGSDWQSEDFDQREEPGTRELYLDRGTTATADLSLSVLAGSALGGGTAVNWQTSLRLPDQVRAQWAESSGCGQFAADSFTRSLDSVCERLHVGIAESIVNPNNAVLQRGCESLGYDWAVTPRNSRGCDASQCGNCVYGCRHGGKQSAAATYLSDAQSQGETKIVARCRADQVAIRNGKAERVMSTVVDRAGRRHRVEVRASTVIVACGSLHSPVLLMRSGIRSPQLGRNLYLHPTTGIGAIFDEPIDAWKGPPQTILCDEFAPLRDGYGFRIETAPAHPGLIALATPWLGARQHRENMQQSGHKSLLIVLVRDRSTGVVSTDRAGRPVISYRPGRDEEEMLRTGIVAAGRVARAAGANNVQTLHTSPIGWTAGRAKSVEDGFDDFSAAVHRAPASGNHLGLFSAHQMGTCRMGSDPRSAVCDARGAVFGVRGLFVADASAFPDSSGVNPMITIMALAHHTALSIVHK